jgi:hypothetical protein
MPAGWRTVICEFWPSRTPGSYQDPDSGEIAIVQRLSPDEPDPTPAQLNQVEASFVRGAGGGVAHARVVAMFWFGPPVLTVEQQKALAGLP